jgi:hypothetical protein
MCCWNNDFCSALGRAMMLGPHNEHFISCDILRKFKSAAIGSLQGDIVCVVGSFEEGCACLVLKMPLKRAHNDGLGS